MKKIIKSTIWVLVLTGIIYSGLEFKKMYDSIQETYDKVGVLKDLSLEDLNQQPVVVMAKSDRKKIIVKYSTGCAHCNKEIEVLKSLKDKLQYFDVYMLSYNSIKTINQFVKEHDLENDETFNFYHDKGTELSFFNNQILPAIYIYDGLGELEYFHEGYQKKKDLERIIEEAIEE